MKKKIEYKKRKEKKSGEKKEKCRIEDARKKNKTGINSQ